MQRPLAETWRRILEGDPLAWEELVAQYAGLVYSTARRYGLKGSDAEDCAQHTWMSLYTGRQSIKDPSKLPVWLISTAGRTARRILRKHSSRTRVEQEAQPAAVQTSPEEDLMRLQRRAVLEYALGELDPRCQRLLRALFFAPGDLSYEDIADQLRIPINSLGPTRMRCLEKLKKILENLDSI